MPVTDVESRKRPLYAVQCETRQNNRVEDHVSLIVIIDVIKPIGLRIEQYQEQGMDCLLYTSDAADD